MVGCWWGRTLLSTEREGYFAGAATGGFSELDWWGVGVVACSSRRSERVTVLGVSLGTLRWGEWLRARVREALLLGRVQRLRVRERVARVLGQ